MKVLFAVNDENISTSIVKKYQKQYKEIISYKNVYYFNAILKELQRNKNYDRVVISEDLEEFTSSSLEQKDKFIFERLDNISDEAVAVDGSDIPIILICSERRTKSEDILVKLFGIGIYNAVLGKDRTTEAVCELIYKPRSKKEAKIYYKIDAENVSYEKENESDVNEVELQNILMHFKKLGTNEEKYAESFSNIVSQYNKAQLKVIIAVLPNEVKDILANSSPEFQKLVNMGGKNPQLDKNYGKKTKNTRTIKKGTTEKLLEVESNSMMSKPVIVPTTMKKNMYLNIDEKKKIDMDDIDLEEDDDDLTNLDDIIEEKPKKRGRPRKNPLPEIKEESETKPRKRGRPRKPKVVEEKKEEIIDTMPGFDDEEDETTEELNYNNFVEKEAQEESNGFDLDQRQEESVSVLPGFDQDEDEDDYDDDYDDYTPTAINNNLNQSTNEQYTLPSTNEIYKGNNYDTRKFDNTFEDGEFEKLLTSDKKVIAFVGTSKNGTSFIINNIAQILSSMGVNTAILDATQNKNAYYIYTKNDEDLRITALNSIDNLIKGNANGIKVNNNLTVYTDIPSKNIEMKNSHPIMETLVKNHSLIMIDCDFNTPIEYFDKAQEVCLIQSMDVLTIQPLTEFLKELKNKNILDESKIRIILNKVLRIRGITGKNIVGGMSNYNDPEMSFMTELFDRNTAKVIAQIPFDEDVYAKYLESLIECEIKLNGYPKEIKVKLSTLAEIIYPLLPNNANKKTKKGFGQAGNQYSNSFSSDMNNTLNDMRKRY